MNQFDMFQRKETADEKGRLGGGGAKKFGNDDSESDGVISVLGRNRH